MAEAKILPKPGERNVLITSALPYVNNAPHLGNIIGSVLSADVFSRYAKARQYNTLFVCGTDEYGTVSEVKAIQEGITPREVCDKYSAQHKNVYDWFDIKFDYWGRTSTSQQTTIAQAIFTKLHQNGYLEERTTTQPYCEKHGAYLADRFIEGECPLCGYPDSRGDQCDGCGQLVDALALKKPRCKLDGATPVPRDTTHVFILLDKLQPRVEAWTQESLKKGAWSTNGADITYSWLRKGLNPRSITRDINWGTPVPLPGYEKKTIYSWFDACIGYVSITANYTEDWEKWWRDPDNVDLYQFMGKDNVPFHTAMFPSSQLGTDERWTMLHHLSTTDYLTYEGGKFSKSRGVGVFGENARDTGVGPDVWRYYLLSHRPETNDSEFEWKAFIDGNNNVLLKNLGNFVNRVIKYVGNEKIYAGVVPDYVTEAASPDFDGVREHVSALLKQYIADMEAVKLRAGLATALRVSDEGNLLLQSNTLDNRLFAERPARCAAVVGTALSLIHLLASLIEPFMPATSAGMLRQLGAATALPIPDEWNAASIPAGRRLGKAEYLFAQIKPEKEQEWREMYGGEEARREKAEKAAKAAARKADKEKKKARKAAEAAAGDASKPGVEAVTDGVKQTLL